MQYIIGIDGGGTKTHCIAASLDKKVVYECYGGPSNFLTLGTEKVSETIFSLVENCKNNLRCRYFDIQIILIGTGGAGRKSDALNLEKAFTEYSAKKNVEFNCFKVESDAAIALEGAYSGGPGCILIAGTGSIIYCKNDFGKIYRAGGFGKLIGDDGGGYSIGRKGLNLISKELDGRCENSIILKLAAEKFGVNSSEQLIDKVYKNNFNIASAAPVVIEAASLGDQDAMKIINEESEELVLHVLAMLKKAGDTALNVVLMGGLLNNDNIYSRTLRKKLLLEISDIKIKGPENSPAMGAVLMASKIINPYY